MDRVLDVRDRRVTVMGLGLFGGGAAVARHLVRRGARVTVTDLRNERDLAPALRALEGCDLRFVLGGHREEDFTRADAVVANPAVPPTSPWLRAARAAGVRVTSEMELFLDACPARIAAITGTQGKSSTCSMLHQLLEGAGLRARLGGNIGRSLIEDVDAMTADEIVVLEVSSYQLEALPEPLAFAGDGPRVEAACITNILPDHLERHGTLEAYASAKRRILDLAARCGGWEVLSGEEPRLAAWRTAGARRVDVWPTRLSDQGLNLRDGRFRLHRETLGSVRDLALAGTFQRANALVAIGIARLLGADSDRLAAAVPALRGLPHRLEDLGLVRGHRVWDNGISTTPDSTLAVLDSVRPGCTLVVGGKGKGLPLEDLTRAARGRVRRVVAFGHSGAEFAQAFAEAGIESAAVPDLAGAAEAAFEGLGPEEEVLFSPACASFDQFLNFRDRALAFRALLERLKAGAPGGRAGEVSLDGSSVAGYS